MPEVRKPSPPRELEPTVFKGFKLDLNTARKLQERAYQNQTSQSDEIRQALRKHLGEEN